MPFRAVIQSTLLALTLFAVPGLTFEQSASTSAPQPEPSIPSAIELLSGIDPASHIQYARLVLAGSLHIPSKAISAQPPPRLIAQCSLRPAGKYVFELFATFGGDADLAFYPPWKPSSSADLFPPRTEKATITMEFLGYTHVKPLKRQWEIPIQTPGHYRFNPPGRDSSNLEEIAYDLRYLLALPTLRLTLANTAAEFLATPLIEAIRKEPLCAAASL